MTPCPRGGGEVLIQGRATIQEIQHSDLGRHPPLLFPPPPLHLYLYPYQVLVNVNINVNVHVNQEWDGYSTILSKTKAKTHLSLASIGRKRENCTTDS